ncbi:MAG TPA: hypothetical protein VK796_03940 [Cytophaga sp.]|jgi:hypothetical protein|nr:hypothetical protein [Cytophaga sp.]
MNFEHERSSFLRSIKKTPFPKITSKKVMMEMLANGIAAICAFIVYKILQNFIVVKSVKNLWGLANKKDKMIVSKQAFETISSICIFIIAIFVFTYVEELIENYLSEREERNI